MALDGHSHRRIEETLPHGETTSRFEPYADGSHLFAVRLDVWLWRLDRKDLTFPDGVVVETVTSP